VGRRGVISSFKLFLPFFATLRAGGRTQPPVDRARDKIKFLLIFKKISESLLPYFFARDEQKLFNANTKNIPALFMHSQIKIFVICFCKLISGISFNITIKSCQRYKKTPSVCCSNRKNLIMVLENGCFTKNQNRRRAKKGRKGRSVA
jgi:hypothetical protein